MHSLRGRAPFGGETDCGVPAPEQGPEQDPEQLSGLLSERMPGQLPDAKGRNKEMEPFSLVIRS